jgi:ADP-heptose:LPS heptosyltransferase
MPEKKANDQIKLSIITVNLNNAFGLKETAQSVSRLAYKYYEWLIIDGASKDGSLQVIKEFNHLITKLVSEPDSGIYDAMNKGVRLASGNMLLFMNSGDVFADSNCLDFLYECEYSEKEILIGKSQLTNFKTIYPTTEDSVYLNRREYFYNGFIPHQATFIPQKLLLNNPYSKRLKSASDLEFILKMHFHKNINLVLFNKTIALCDETGYSNDPMYQKSVLREIYHIRYKYLGISYFCYICRHKFKNLLNRILRLKKLIELLPFILRKVKKLVKLLLFKTLNLLIKIEKIIVYLFPVSRIILIIRPDNIGDYILFRNFLQELYQTPQYKDYKFWLLGNRAFKDLAETLDKQYVKKFVWVNSGWYNLAEAYEFNDFKYKRHVFKIKTILQGKKYHSIIYPVFSRCTCYDKLCHELTAKHKIAMGGDKVNMVNSTNLYEHAYSQIIEVDQRPGIFEFYRNREFISGLLNRNITQIIPTIDITLLPKHGISLPENYVAFHMDASGSASQWPSENYLQIAEYIYQKYKLPVVLLGRNSNPEFFTNALANIGIINLYNRTSLPEAAAILSKARLFIGNDSGLLHIAAAVGVQKIICLCKGNYYGRFVPYPDVIAQDKYFFLFPPVIERELENQDLLKQKYADGSFEDIKTIEVSHVLKIIDIEFGGCHR